MKVMMMLQNMEVGGIQRLVVDDANELYRRGVDMRVVCFEREKGTGLASALTVPREHIVYIPYARMRDVRAFFRLVRYVWAERPDVILTHHWFANTVGRLAGFLMRMQVLAFEHSDYSSRYTRRQLFINRMLQVCSPRIIAVSESVRSALIRQGIDAHRIEVVPNGIDLARFSSIKKKSHSMFTFLFLGRLVEDKCVDDALRACANISNARLLIAGSGPQEGALRALAHELRLPERVSFLGARTDVETLLAEVDCVVLPSQREGFGLVAIEALASGIPAIVSDIANASGAVKDGINGFVVPVRDIHALSGAMTRIASRAEEYERLAANTRKSMERFSIQKHVDHLLAVIASLRAR